MLSSLPHVVVDLVWRFLLTETELNPPAYRSECQGKGKPHGDAPDPFLALASVSKEWLALIDVAASERMLQRLTLDFRNLPMGRKTLLEMRRQLTLQRATLQQLKFNSIPAFTANADQYWASLLSLTPHIHVLNLDEDCWTSPRSDEVAEAVRAAGLYCPKIRDVPISCIMKRPSGYDRSRGLAYRLEFASVLFQSSAEWLKADHVDGGLRRLLLSMGRVFKDIATGSRFLHDIADCCPNIEVLDGYESVIPGYNTAECDELWMADLASWRYFCMRCTQPRSCRLSVPTAIHAS